MRTLATRIAEHSGVSIRTGNLLSSPPYSAIREHLETHGGVKVNSCNFKVLDSASYDLDLKILETLYTLQQRPTIVKAETSLTLRLPE